MLEYQLRRADFLLRALRTGVLGPLVDRRMLEGAEAFLSNEAELTKSGWMESPIVLGWIERLRWAMEEQSTHRFEELVTHMPNMLVGVSSEIPNEVLCRSVNGVCATWDPLVAFRSSNAVKLLTSEQVVAALSVPRTQNHLEQDGCIYPPLARDRIVVRNDLPPLQPYIRPDAPPERHGSVEYDRFDYAEQMYSAFSVPRFDALLQRATSENLSFGGDIRDLLRVVVPFSVPMPGWYLGGFTIGAFQGCVWIGEGEFYEQLEQLIHEVAHIKMRYLEANVPLLENHPSELFPVPWRSDPRPIQGIAEGVFVHAHCLLAFRELAATGFQDSVAQEQLEELRSEVSQGCNILSGSARFTPAGEMFFEWCREAIA